MRVLFQTVADKSHLHIAAPLAWAMRSAGHEVLVAARPGIEDAIRLTGLTAVTIGKPDEVALTSRMNDADPTATAAPAPTPGPRRGPTNQDAYARDDLAAEWRGLVEHLFPVMSPDDAIDDLVEVARAWGPDLVVWDMLTYGGPVAARAAGAAHARLVLATDGVGQLRSGMRANGTLPDPEPLATWLGPHLARCGAEFDDDVVLGDVSIDLMPPWTSHPPGVSTVAMRHVPFNGPAVLPEWLLEPQARHRVGITLGNSHRDAGRVEASAPALLEAVADLDVEVVATLRRDQLGGHAVPDNVRTVDFVPLNELLPTCSALVHHGGAGTFAGAVQHGVPQLIVPSTWWSEKWYGPVAMADGVAREGAGVYVADSDELTAGGLRDAVSRVLGDPSFARQAAELARRNSTMPAPTQTVATLEELTRLHRGRR